MDDNVDRFTSSREGVISDDPTFQKLLSELKDDILKIIIEDWDIWRVEEGREGDSENTRMTKEGAEIKRIIRYGS